jgi:hypothetical protein
MAATLFEFVPRDWSLTSRELDGKGAAIELLLGLRAGRRPLLDEDGRVVGWCMTERLYLCAEGRDKLRSMDLYLAWRYHSLCCEMGRQIVSGRLLGADADELVSRAGQLDLDPLIG